MAQDRWWTPERIEFDELTGMLISLKGALARATSDAARQIIQKEIDALDRRCDEIMLDAYDREVDE